MTAPQPTMLWENTDPHAALRQRFGFASAQAAAAWLTDQLNRHYAIEVLSVERLVISAANLLAWLTTAQGRLLAKGCAQSPAYPHLQQLAGLLPWLAQEGLPVSPPLPSRQGERQVICDQLSIGVQRVIPGTLLDPAQPAQAQAAGLLLARLHEALSSYPQTSHWRNAASLASLTETVGNTTPPQPFATGEPVLLATWAMVQERAAMLAQAEPGRQLVHGDYRAANILWQQGAIAAVLDFEETAWGYRVNDLAWAAVHLGTRYHHWGPVSPLVRATFVGGYTAHQPLSPLEARWLPILLAWHSINLAWSARGGPTAAACLAAAAWQHFFAE
jgi:homoserine kinase type II